MPLIRTDQADIRVSINQKPYFDNWATYQGGDATATDAKTRTGGMNRERSAGGPKTRDDITLTIAFDDVIAGFHNEIENMIGESPVAVSIQYVTGPQRTAIDGAHFTRFGVLKSAHLPKADVNAAGSVEMYEIVVSADEQAA